MVTIMRKDGILVASFGTSYVETEIQCIKAVERQIGMVYKDKAIYRGYTSNIVRNILEKRGTPVDSVDEALLKMHRDGMEQVFIQPTLLIYGEEYEKIKRATENYNHLFNKIEIGRPLLGDTQDMINVANVLGEEFKSQSGTAIVLMGHGTPHYCNTVYAAMEFVLHESGYKNYFMGTVEAYPDFNVVMKKVEQAGVQKVKLVPFMLVAGDHVTNDMAGDNEDSWKSQFIQAGFQVETVLKGLGQYPQIQKIYCEHVGKV